MPAGWGNITVSGRRVLVYVPKSMRAASPLIVAIHGVTMSPEQFANPLDLPRYVFGAAKFAPNFAERKGVVLAYPAGSFTDHSFNAGACCSTAVMKNVDDVQFMRDIVKHMIQSGCADPRRVYATGFSNGGFMTYRLGCEASDMFAAISPTAGLLGDILYFAGAKIQKYNCNPSRHVPVLHWHGSADSIVGTDGTYSFASSRSIDSCFDYFSQHNKCNPDKAVISLNRNGWHCKSAVCDNPHDNVTLCVIQGMDHQWTVGSEPFIWDFFSRYTL
jgi:polyhydroxybutyrate depolymerase